MQAIMTQMKWTDANPTKDWTLSKNDNSLSIVALEDVDCNFWEITKQLVQTSMGFININQWKSFGINGKNA